MMRTYEIGLVVAFFLLMIIFVWNGIKSYQQVSAEEDKKLRTAARRKALLLMTPGLMFFLSALYIIFRVSWIFLIVVLIGNMAAAYAIGSGIGANMKEH